MPYSTRAQVQTAMGGFNALIQTADPEGLYPGDGGAGAMAAVDAAIDLADGNINAYLRQRYSVPLAGGNITNVVQDLSSRWAARILRRNNWRMQPLESDVIAEEADIKLLMRIARGDVQLGIEPTPAKSGIVIDKAGARDSTKSLTRDRLKSFL